ncbi:MAG TPA: precorrin-6y C5,15-methyltransferase (decarboxylating) subunit CbiE [Albidovulum sp.]|uniref:precorrin-6y C5,15-methyltransferase (decarboxylating) subunit CbiE n=1 Tax=Albidovulum sp. TaxID=1872424 RepID=UPI002C0DF33A|nr:precorrin-6y C5,15-methyltransferase (decarboxylating) subunit CbiE [Albidovulum sp.]
MSDPWLTIIGLGEDGPAGLSDASRAALAAAEVIFGGPRHLELVTAGDRGRPWPVPFSTAPVLGLRGRKVAVLASGDPFWFGAGGSLVPDLSPGEWTCHPAPSAFSLAAARMGWRLEEVLCFGLHAAPFERLRPVLSEGTRILCLLRDGASAGTLCGWLNERGFGASTVTVLEALRGPRERVRRVTAGEGIADVAAPVAVAIEAMGAKGLSRAPGLPDDLFAHDGQITKRAIRALTLSVLSPRAGEVFWDLGAGSGSISVEWCLAAPGARAHAVEARAERAANIRANAAGFGVEHRLTVHDGDWPALTRALPRPDAVFVGGGLDGERLAALWAALPESARLVVNTVTIGTEALVADWHGRIGGMLSRFDIAEAAPLGRMQGWVPARPVVQWSVVR